MYDTCPTQAKDADSKVSIVDLTEVFDILGPPLVLLRDSIVLHTTLRIDDTCRTASSTAAASMPAIPSHLQHIEGAPSHTSTVRRQRTPQHPCRHPLAHELQRT